jgi:pimeloyl-ACP methyl ester carboxylesterase
MQEHKLTCTGEAGAHDVAYVEWGDPNNPKTLVCVHGLTRTAMDFEPLAESMADVYRVISIDMPGRRNSDWLHDKSKYSYPVYVADCMQVIANVGAQEVDWVGTSMGGLIGMLVAALSDSPIRKFVINDIGPFLPKEAQQRIGTYVGKDPRFETFEALVEDMKANAATFGPLTEEQWRFLATHSAKKHPDGSFGYHYDPGIADAFKGAKFEDISLWDMWNEMRCEVLILRGKESDLLLPETAQHMCERPYPTKLIEWEGMGHAPSLLPDYQINEIRAWLLA